MFVMCRKLSTLACVNGGPLEPLAKQDMEEGGGKYLHVGPQALVFEIIEVEVESAEHLLHSVGVAVVQRGVRGDAGTYGI